MQKKLKISHHHITCPHCKQKVNKEWLFICTTDQDVKYVYICSSCEEIIGVFNNILNEALILDARLQ